MSFERLANNKENVRIGFGGGGGYAIYCEISNSTVSTFFSIKFSYFKSFVCLLCLQWFGVALWVDFIGFTFRPSLKFRFILITGTSFWK